MITIARLREELRLPADRDGDLASIIAETVGLWEAETRRLWAWREDHTQVILPFTDRLSTIWLELGPVAEVTQVQESQGYPGETATTLDATIYTQYGSRGLRRLDGAWAPGVRVTYSGGYAAETAAGPPVIPATPPEIARAFLIQARFRLARTGDANIAIQSQNFEGGSGVYLDPYMHPAFAGLAKRLARKV